MIHISEKQSSETSGQAASQTADRIRKALVETGQPQLRSIRVEVEADVVVMSGQLSSYYLKQLAQATVTHAAENHHLQDRLVVQHEN